MGLQIGCQLALICLIILDLLITEDLHGNRKTSAGGELS